MNSIIVVSDCVVRVSQLPEETFLESTIVQPWSPYFYPLLWSGLATDSGLPAEPSGPEVYPVEPVLVQRPFNSGFSTRWNSVDGKWELYDPADFAGTAPDLDDLGDVDLTDLEDGDALTYDLTENKWVAAPPGGGGGPVADGSITAVKLADAAVVLSSSKVSGTLPITRGGTNATTANAARANLGVDQVDNTPDVDKPISGPQQEAFDLKQALSNALTQIAALTPLNNDIIQRKAGVWVTRNMSQLAADLDVAVNEPLFYTPEQFGAVGDGIADDSVPVQECFDACYDAGGGTALLRQRYGCTGDIKQRGACTVRGVSLMKVLSVDDNMDRGIFALDDTFRYFYGQWAGVGASTDDNPGGLYDLVISGDGVGGAEDALFIAQAVDGYVSNVRIMDGAGHGLMFDGTQNSTFEGCLVGGHVNANYAFSRIDDLGQGAGSVKINNCYGGTSGKQIYADSDPAHYWAHDIFFNGCLFENYEEGMGMGHTRSGDFHFDKCVFTNSNDGDPVALNDCLFLVEQDIHPLIPTQVTFTNCYFNGSVNMAHLVRVKTPTDSGQIGNYVRFYGKNYFFGADYVVCLDGGGAFTSQVNIDGDPFFVGGGGASTPEPYVAINGAWMHNIQHRKVTPTRWDMPNDPGGLLPPPLAIRRRGESFDTFQVTTEGGVYFYEDAAVVGSIVPDRVNDKMLLGGTLQIANQVEYRGILIFAATPGVAVPLSGAKTAAPYQLIYFSANGASADITISGGQPGVRVTVGLQGTGTNVANWSTDFHFIDDDELQPVDGKVRFIEFQQHVDGDWHEVTRSAGAGLPGADGTDGTNGTNGSDGAAGPAGPPGPLGTPIVDTLSTGSYTLNPSFGTDYTFTALGNITFAASGMQNGSSMYVEVIQDSVGGRTVNFPSTMSGYDTAMSGHVTTGNTITGWTLWKTGGMIHVVRSFFGSLPSGFWTPNALTNQIAWFDASSISGEDGDTVTAWNNPWGVDGTVAGAPVLKVLNGEKYVLFDGTDDHIDADHGAAGAYSGGAQPFVIALLAKVPGNGPVISSTAGNTTGHDLITASGNWEVEPASGLTRVNSAAWQTVIAEYKTGGNDSLRVDGSAKTDVNVNAIKVARWTRIAADDTGTHNAMSVAEVIKVYGTIDGTTQANIEAYLNAKRDNLNA